MSAKNSKQNSNNNNNNNNNTNNNKNKHAESLSQQFSLGDWIFVLVFILLLVALGYAIIKYDIVSQQDYSAALQKYNATITPSKIVATTKDAGASTTYAIVSPLILLHQAIESASVIGAQSA